MQASQQTVQEKHYWECPECHSRFFSEPVTLGAKNGQLVKIHPICHECFSKCPQGHEFGYGENCNKCGAPRRRFNLVCHAIPADDPTFGVTSTGSTSYPTTTAGNSSGTTATGGANYWMVYKVVVSTPLTVTSLTGYVPSGQSPYNTRWAVWNDNGSVYPGSLWNDFGQTTGTGSKTVTISAKFMPVGTYWFGFNVPSSGYGYAAHDGGTSGETYSVASTYGAAPDPYPGGGSHGTNTVRYNIYVTGRQIKGYAKAYISTLSETALVTSVSFYSHATGNARLAIFTVSGGAPNAKQWESGSIALTASAWNTPNISDGTPTSLALLSGDYAHAWQVDTANDAPSYAAGTAGYGNYIVQAYGAFPSTWTGGTATAEKWSMYSTYTQGDTVTVSDSITLFDAVTIQDSDSVTATDSIALAETVTLLDADFVTVTDTVKLAEFAWHTKGHTMVGSVELPHVQSIKITDEAVISDRKIEGGSLPFRKMLGKPGRVVEVEGWTKSQTDIDNMNALNDGDAKTFLHPSGDSFAVLVIDFNPDLRVDEYDRRIYQLTLVELRSW